MNALEMVGLTQTRRGELNLKWYAVRNEHDAATWAEYLALATMRALVAWGETQCLDMNHHSGEKRVCLDCWAELRTALEVE